MSVSELVENTGISQANLSQHLAILKSKGIVAAHRKGLNVYYAISNPKIIKIFDLISEILHEASSAQNKTVGAGMRRKT